jgi:hypothetical protein
VNGLRGLARAPWDEPDTSAADEAADRAAAAHQAQCNADDAAAERETPAARLAAQSCRLLALAVAADDAGDPELAERRRARALIDRRHASLAAIGGAR